MPHPVDCVRVLPKEFEALQGKRLLVTGAAGFIGEALLRRLNEYGLDAIGTTRLEEEAKCLEKEGLKALPLDLSDNRDWTEALEGASIIFNLAAMFQELSESRKTYELVNLHGTLKLFDCACKAGVERFVHCSTVGVHGHVKQIPCTEETPFNPMDEYHETKLAGELAILEKARELPPDGPIVTINRPAMVYGPGDLRMLKLFKAVNRKKFVMVGNGHTLAHLGFIEDQVDSFLLQAVAPKENCHLEAFNIASGNPITLQNLVHLIAEACKVPKPKLKVPLAPVWLASALCEGICRPIGIQPPLFRRRIGFFTHNRAFDYSKAERLIGYKSNWGEHRGIKETVKWYNENNLL